MVGLRVYSEDTDSSVEVVRLDHYPDEEAGGSLDRDDPAAAREIGKDSLQETFWFRLESHGELQGRRRCPPLVIF